MTRPTAAILLTGSELLRGVISDRNAAYLAERLESLGFSMRRTLMVGDPLADIEQGFRELAGAHDLIVTSGGLGPTHDDRTVEALAAVGGVPLELDEAVLARITSWTDEVAERMGFDRARFDAGNRKQARIPRGAQVLGMAGTAPGLVMAVDGSVVVVLPGVPSELRRLWQLAPEHPLLAPLIARAQPRQRLMLRTYGIGESHVADLFEQAGGDPDGVETSICARNYEVEIDIRSTAEGEAAGLQLWQRLQADLEPHLFATDERPIARDRAGAGPGAGADAGHGGVLHGRDGGGRADGHPGQLGRVRGRSGHLLGPAQARAAGRPRGHARTARRGQRRDRAGDGGGRAQAAGRRPGGGGDRRGRPRRRH